MIDPAYVSAVLVTRGDVDLEPILQTLRPVFDDIVVWDNSTRPIGDQKVYGRYQAISEARHPVIYTQDDDCIVPVEELLYAYRTGLLVNVPAGEHPWLAWGALFQRNRPLETFARYLNGGGHMDDDFFNWADVVFAEMHGWSSIDLGHQDLPCATAANRMYHQPDHYTGQQRVRDRCRQLLAAA